MTEQDREPEAGAGLPPEEPVWQPHHEVLVWSPEKITADVLAKRDRLCADAIKTLRHELGQLRPLDQVLAAWLLGIPGVFSSAARKALPDVTDADLLARASTRLETALGIAPRVFEAERERVEDWLDLLTERVRAEFERAAEEYLT
jgi:hypothetical protein